MIWLRLVPYLAIAVLGGLLWIQTQRISVAHGERDNAIAARKQAEMNFEVAKAINESNLDEFNAFKNEAARRDGIAADAIIENDMLHRKIRDIVRSHAAPIAEAAQITPAYVCDSFNSLRGDTKACSTSDN